MSHLGTATAKVVGLGLLMSMSWQLKNEYTSGSIVLLPIKKSMGHSFFNVATNQCSLR
jgi:hypothetical protein